MLRKCNVTLSRWDEATEFFELGLVTGKDLAVDLGVSPQTVMREMRRRGATKGSRAHETVIYLVARLGREARHQADMKAAAELTILERRAAGVVLLKGMLAALLEADRDGDLTLADPAIAQAAAMFGTSAPRNRRRR